MKITKEMLKDYKGETTNKLTIYGETKVYETYRIPIDWLYYNDKNGRIATFINEYEDSHGTEKLKQLFRNNRDEYNDLLAKYIKSSAGDKNSSFKKTKEDIRTKGQRVPGVVLDDGRIIDGNRRFTAIRELYKETNDPAFAYFEATLLTPSNENNGEYDWKEIIALELYLQYNEDKKRDYNPIDHLVGVYKDIDVFRSNGLGKEKYCESRGISEGELNHEINVIYAMLDYLEWRGKPKAFYLLKEDQLDGPMKEIASVKAKMKEKLWDENKEYIYNFITFRHEGDVSREVRKLLGSLKSKEKNRMFESFKSELKEPNNKQILINALKIKNQRPLTFEDTLTEEAIENQEIVKNASLFIKTSFEKAEREKYQDDCDKEPLDYARRSLEYAKQLDTWASVTFFKFDDIEMEDYSIEKVREIIAVTKEIEKTLGEIATKLSNYISENEE